MSVVSSEPETMLLPSGEKATELMQPLCTFSFSALSFREAATRRGGSVLGVRVAFRGISAHAPASQTLIVLSAEPDTMFLPSGEKATENTQSLCALCFSAFSSREAAASVGALRFGLGEVSGRLVYLHPTL